MANSGVLFRFYDRFNQTLDSLVYWIPISQIEMLQLRYNICPSVAVNILPEQKIVAAAGENVADGDQGIQAKSGVP